MSLMGMRSAIGQAIGQAQTRKQVDALIDVLRMAEDDFDSMMIGDLRSAGAQRMTSSASADRQVANG